MNKKKKLGIILRSYAKKKEDVEGVVQRALESIKHVSNLRDDFGDLMIDEIVVLVPSDYDCGDTAEAIADQEQFLADFGTYVLEAQGHHSCGALNSGVEVLDGIGVDYVIIISNKAIQALTADTVEAMITAFEDGAKVVGVAIDELQDIVLDGRTQNTFVGWDIKALREVGGFDSEKGVEEISPTVRLIRQHGPCVAVLDPVEKPTLDIRKTADGAARHNEVMTTKLARQLEEVNRVGADFDFIKSGIMPGYPQLV